MAEYYTLLSPAGDTFPHTVWLAPTLIANNMFHPVQDEDGDNFLQFANEDEMIKMLKILDYFGIEKPTQVLNDQMQADNALFNSDEDHLP